MNTVGYLIQSHVVQNHVATPILTNSMVLQKIDPAQIVVFVNGTGKPFDQIRNGIHYLFRTSEFQHALAYCALEKWGQKLGITHWFYLNTTSRCGPNFKRYVEGRCNYDADACRATDFVLTGDRPINDMAMYADAFLVSVQDCLWNMNEQGTKPNLMYEGYPFSLAPKKASYPELDRIVSDPTDIYGTGTPRITEYYPGIDWYRYKKNWGQQVLGEYDIRVL